MDPEEALSEAKSIIEALSADQHQARVDVVQSFLAEQDLPPEVLKDSRVFDMDSDGYVTATELSSQIVPMILGCRERASSYRQHLLQMLEDIGFRAEFVGTACKACGSGHRSSDCQSDPWLHWHGCDQGYQNGYDHMAFWSWSARNVLHGNPNQPLRGRLQEWLTSDLQFDATMIHLGTNDLAQGQDLQAIVETLNQIVVLLAEHEPAALVGILLTIVCCDSKGTQQLVNRYF